MNAVVDESASELRRLLDYDMATGHFHWRVWRSGAIGPGCMAGTTISGRVYIRFQGRQQLAHRLAFLHVVGRRPQEQIDHIDGNPLNNAWANLRECSHSENCQNRKATKKNKAGLLGVSKHKSGWQASIAKDKKYYHLGLFKTPEQAHAAYLSAKARLHAFNPIPRDRRDACQAQ